MNELLKEIEYNNSIFPEVQLKEIISRREEFIPELLEILKNTRENYEELSEEGNYFAHIYASFLLAQFKEKESFPLIMDLVSLPGEIPYNLFGDFITEDLYRVIASVCDGNTEPIKRLIENESIDEYVRNAGISALLVLFAEGVISKNEVIEYFKALFEGKLEREYSDVWGALVSAACDIGAVELQEYIKKAFKDELVDTFYICLEDVEHSVKMDDGSGVSLLKDEKYRFVTDTIEELKWWASFEKDSIMSAYVKQSNNKDKNKKRSKRKQVKASKKKQRKR